MNLSSGMKGRHLLQLSEDSEKGRINSIWKRTSGKWWATFGTSHALEDFAGV